LVCDYLHDMIDKKVSLSRRKHVRVCELKTHFVEDTLRWSHIRHAAWRTGEALRTVMGHLRVGIGHYVTVVALRAVLKFLTF